MDNVNGLLVVLASLLPCLIAAGLTWWFCNPGSFFHLLDHPNERSLHAKPTPRTGGIAVLAAIAIVGVVVAMAFPEFPKEWKWFGIVGAILASVSMVDDRVGLPVSIRLVAHIVVAALLIVADIAPYVSQFTIESVGLLAPALVLLLLLFIVWMINLYNFMDGMDGFAGGMAVFGFGTFALLGWLGNHPWFAISNLIVASAAAGFLIFNFPPARIFMGDAGSTTLGFLAGGFMLWAQREQLFSIPVGILVFSPFIIDATVTLLRRLISGEKVWRAHKTHYYQRLVQLGWGHRRTVLWEYGVMTGCAVTAIWGAHQGGMTPWWLLGVWLTAYLGLAAIVHRMDGGSRSGD